MNNKEFFLVNEYISYSIIAGLATRNPNYPIYKTVSETERNELKKTIRAFLTKLYIEVRGKELNEVEQVYSYWSDLKTILTQKHGHILHENHFRIGISQKIVSLFLKYLYCNSIIPNCCVCPIDGIVKQEIQKNESIKLDNWTKITDINSLKTYLDIINKIASKENLSIIDWEIEIWNKNARKNE